MMRSMLTALLLTLTLSGCDTMQEAVQETLKAQSPVKLAIHPGYKVLIDGHLIPFWGDEQCGPQRYEDDCIIIDQGTDAVNVLIAYQTGVMREKWVVKRDGERITLQRPDGSQVIALKE